jgi:hypothetical protein
MGLTIDRVLIANSDTERAIRGALEGVGVPPGEDWTATMTALSRSSAWELILQGPSPHQVRLLRLGDRRG